jgi:molecular chaperone GrpE
MSESKEAIPEEELPVEETQAEEEPQEVEAELETSDSPEATIAKLEAALEEEKGKALRAHAEMVNFRKRQEKERGVWNQMAIKDVISGILDPLDNLERTIQAANHTQEGEENDPKLVTLAEGLNMVVQQFEEVFKRKNVLCIDPKGDDFNPNEHEAYGQIETLEVEEGKVAQVFRKGYKIGDQLIRTATVQVAKKPSESKEEESED